MMWIVWFLWLFKYVRMKKKTLPCIQHTKQLAPNWHGTPSPSLIACLLLLLPFECFFLYSAYLFCVRRLFLWTAMARIYFRCMYVTMCVSESISCIWFSSIRFGLIRHCKSTICWIWMVRVSALKWYHLQISLSKFAHSMS